MDFTEVTATLKRDGLAAVIKRRVAWYRARLEGMLVKIRGNTVEMDGLIYSVAPFSSSLKSVLAKGNHEQPERDLVRRWLPSDLPVVELGGGMGVVSCLANKKLENPSLHVVVEANPAMIPLLEHNRDLNGCSFKVVNKALDYDCEMTTLNIDPDFVGSSAFALPSKTGQVSVPTTTLAAIMSENGFEQCGVLCDIEGLEANLVDQEFAMLGDRIRYLMAETHPFLIGKERTEKMLATLDHLGFVEMQRIGICIFCQRTGLHLN